MATTIRFRPITDIARDLATRCAEHGEWIPSELWARYHRVCKRAGLDVEQTYLDARAKYEEETA